MGAYGQQRFSTCNATMLRELGFTEMALCTVLNHYGNA